MIQASVVIAERTPAKAGVLSCMRRLRERSCFYALLVWAGGLQAALFKAAPGGAFLRRFRYGLQAGYDVVHFGGRRKRIGGGSFDDLAVAHKNCAGQAEAFIDGGYGSLEYFLIVLRRGNKKIIGARAPAHARLNCAGDYPLVLSVAVPVGDGHHVDSKCLRGMPDAEAVVPMRHAAVGLHGAGKGLAQIYIVACLTGHEGGRKPPEERFTVAFIARKRHGGHVGTFVVQQVAGLKFFGHGSGHADELIFFHNYHRAGGAAEKQNAQAEQGAKTRDKHDDSILLAEF